METLALSGGKDNRLRPLRFMGGRQSIPAATQTISGYPLDQVVSAIIRKVGVITALVMVNMLSYAPNWKEPLLGCIVGKG